MTTQEAAQEHEESIRKKVRNLSDDQRLAFFKESEKKLKDPDTYATLNYIFIAGLHHFYLGKWGLGLMNISIFWTGVILLFSDYTTSGLVVIAAISIFEFYELFKSQVIVQEYNNKMMEEIYTQINQ
ncbi:MAG: hypothetical protein Q9M50_10290 [Methylococcales bacterium]|nr:hypothetical protein [Methylococcales bacterium]